MICLDDSIHLQVQVILIDLSLAGLCLFYGPNDDKHSLCTKLLLNKHDNLVFSVNLLAYLGSRP